MAREEIEHSYYGESVSNKWIDIHLSVKCCIEKFLAELLFKNDYSRVLYSQADIALRRRIETLDKGKTGEELLINKFQPISLGLPFASYCQDGDWEADDRPYAQNTSGAVLGIYDMNLYRRLRILPCKAKYKANLYFSRRDDARVAQQLLYWEQEPKHPVWIYSTFKWKDHLIAIPAFLNIESINTSPNWEERKFLESQRIFPVEVDFTVRSYQVIIPNINNIVKLPYRFQNYNVDEGDNMYITEETLLEFTVEKWDVDDNVEKVDLSNIDLNANARKYFADDNYTQNQLKVLAKSLPNNTTADIIRGYFNETTEVNLNSFLYYEPTSTTTSAVIKYAVKPADYKYFQKITFVVPGKEPIEITDCKQKEVVINNLHPNSIYDCVILTYSTTGTVTTFNLSFTTKADKNDTAPTPEKINAKIPGLVGMHI